jgi:hypothetical protein
MQSLYENEEEEELHVRAIEELAQEVNQPIAGVKAVYEGEFARLKSDAKITEYLALFASRRARETLRRKHA